MSKTMHGRPAAFRLFAALVILTLVPIITLLIAQPGAETAHIDPTVIVAVALLSLRSGSNRSPAPR